MNYGSNYNKQARPFNGRSFVARLFSCRRLGIGFIVTAALLLVLNIAGLVIPLRNSEIYTEPLNKFPKDITLTYDELWKRVTPIAGEPRADYLVRVTQAVADGMAHLQIDDPEVMRKYNWRIPIWENYVLWASRHALNLKLRLQGGLEDGRNPYRYVFADYRRIARRGIGLCSQHSFLLAGILREAGVPFKIIGYGRHAVVEAEVSPGTWWILDPDFAVVVPFDVATVNSNPELAQPFYLAKGHEVDWHHDLRNIVSNRPVGVFASTKEAQGEGRYYFEYISYWMIWIMPIVLIKLGLLCLHRAARPATCPEWSGAQNTPSTQKPESV